MAKHSRNVKHRIGQTILAILFNLWVYIIKLRRFNQSRAKFLLVSGSNHFDFFDPNLKPDFNSSRHEIDYNVSELNRNDGM